VVSYRILIADDHPLFRDGLRRILCEKSDIEVVGEAEDGLEVLKPLQELVLKKLMPQLVTLEISMPNLRGIEIIQDLKAKYPEMKILVLTMYKDKEYFYQSMFAGADGFFVKNEPGKELFAAIKKIRQGKQYVSPFMSEELARDPLDEAWKIFQKRILTTREIEVLNLIAEGKSNKEIGVLLSISIDTGENHRANIMNKLNLRGTADLTRYAIEKGYL